MDKQAKKTPTSPSAVKRSLPYAKGFGWMVLIAMVFAIVANIGAVVIPDMLSQIMDLITEGVMTGINLDSVNEKGTRIALYILVIAVIAYLQTFLIGTVSQRFTQRLRTAVGDKMNRLPLSYFDQRATGDILSLVTNDLDTVAQALNNSLGGLVSAIVMLIGSTFMMIKINGWMALAAISSSIIGFVGVGFVMGKSAVYFKKQQANLADLNGLVEESYSGLTIVNAYNGAGQMSTAFQVKNEALFESAWKSQFFSGIMMPLMGFVGNFGYVVICIVGAALVLNGSITIGVIVAFMVYVRIFTQPLSQIAQAAQSLQSAQAALGRVMDYLEAAELSPDATSETLLTQVKGQVAFEAVKFGYNPEVEIIHNFSALAKPGQKVAIVGPTGAGKTTIVNLLMRFYELNAGRITIDGIDISQMSREELHRSFSMVLQDTWLFEGTIRDNLRFNRQDVSHEDLEKAAKSVGIHRFIKTLPDGYDTYLDDTVSLSVGQKQLMTIARALIKDAPLLILDEATSSVDTRTEELIQDAMDTLMLGRTSFVIAHRLSTIRNADLILVMKDGNIIEQGNHEQLMQTGGFYADLYNSQFEEGGIDEELI
ncbi:TPA: ABC transporter ATP-binding protein [Streptococcus suis]